MLLIPIFAAALAATPADFFVGVLEEQHDVGEADAYVQARVLFVHDANGWRALPAARGAYPLHVDWHACTAHALGAAVASELPQKWDASDVGVHMVDDAATKLLVGDPDEQFAGWHNDAVRAPLVLTSGAACGDPDHFADAPLKKLPKAATRNREVLRAYRAADGTTLVETRHCTQAACTYATLSKPARGAFTPIVPAHLPDSAPFELTLVNAVDFSADGSSELLFKVQGDTFDGYILYDTDFNELARFIWTYP